MLHFLYRNPIWSQYFLSFLNFVFRMITYHLSISSSSNYSINMYTGDPILDHSTVLFRSRILPSSLSGTCTCYFLGTHPPPFAILVWWDPFPCTPHSPHFQISLATPCPLCKTKCTHMKDRRPYKCEGDVSLPLHWIDCVLRQRLWLTNHLPS